MGSLSDEETTEGKGLVSVAVAAGTPLGDSVDDGGGAEVGRLIAAPLGAVPMVLWRSDAAS